MQLHQLKSPKQKNKKRVGRGGKRGTYSGRGIKGQKARAGHRIRPAIRDTIKTLPKKRGYRMQTSSKFIAEVSIGDLEEKFQEGEIVIPKLLVERGLVEKRGGKITRVKILASGKLIKKLFVKDCLLSKGAKLQIEKLGGSIS